MLATVAGAFGAVPWLQRPAMATPATVAAAMRDIVGDAKLQPGRVKLDLPPIAENGNAVAVSVRVESPMTAADHVRSIHLFAEGNPLPNVANFFLGPRAGRAVVATRMRLATSQKVIAVAQLSDGTWWTDSAEIFVTLAACTEG
ncbi:MAG: putative sulfur oxidation protein soxY [Rhodospirillales bacterium]|nr:putative sulfur oxidation protein soxY [Rhodospirillales bacterium]